jgi:hypothetical protein
MHGCCSVIFGTLVQGERTILATRDETWVSHDAQSSLKNGVMPTLQQKTTKIRADTFSCKNHGQRFFRMRKTFFDSLLALWRDH